ncbi:MAG: BREX system P-loop protein BrxC, partial [Planctomycetaceae bacterium]|nr:BREX system P-loop protein BrxC [Planctomycetaceae bacterium]
MRISELFKKDIARPINGVVKADQLDKNSVWQELDEFVVTRELTGHLQKFFEQYCETLQCRNHGTASKNGVWVSGFFGSGKSHFIKVISHLLANEVHEHFDSDTQKNMNKKAVEFFDEKITGSFLLGNIKKAAGSNTDVILFNIDSKADDKDSQREKFNVVLGVFLRVLNQKLGYSPDHFHIAHLERYLDEKGKYQEFQNIYKTLTATEWKNERDAYEFNRDEVIEAFSKVLGQSKDAGEKWFESAEKNVPINVENFAKWTKEYLDRKGKNSRIMFLADEVGQFIGSNTTHMLNLQTIVEQLGTVCAGRAWVVVTSQEDIDTVIKAEGNLRQDFSKIQGRFATRLSLSSRNVDEVIQERLLRKKDDPAVKESLSLLYREKSDILKNQLSFKDCQFTWSPLSNEDDFIRTYPFVPYQFKLLQRIFESIRRIGVAGIHLAQGERSLLDAFQQAAKSVTDNDVGALVPLYCFFTSIESFLESTIRRSFEHAETVGSLEKFDVNVLRVLFLIRHVDEMKSNIENLVTLCLDKVDTDRIDLKKRIEESLDRLEKESLIKSNSGIYYFLTNEEQEISREIKNITISVAERSKYIGKVIFDENFHEKKKYQFSKTKKDFLFNRLCDNLPIDRQIEKATLLVSIISPFCDDSRYESDPFCCLTSTENNGKILIRLQKSLEFETELKKFLSTKNYINRRNSNNNPETEQILKDLTSENRLRQQNIVTFLNRMLTEADYFIAGQKQTFKSMSADSALDEALRRLIENTYNKLNLLQNYTESPEREIHAVLYRDDVSKLHLEEPENNPLALAEIRNYINLASQQNKEINLYDACNRFSDRPFGWVEKETVLLFVRLHAAGEIHFVQGGDFPNRNDLEKILSDPKKWIGIGIRQKKISDTATIKKTKELGREIFAAMGPDTDNELYKFLTQKMEERSKKITEYIRLIDSGKYPGKKVLEEFASLIRDLLRYNENETHRFFEKFNGQSELLRKSNEEYHDVCHFFEHQKTIWDDMLKRMPELELNKRILEKEESVKDAFRNLDEIVNSATPYQRIREIPSLLNKIATENDKLLEQIRTNSLKNTIESVSEILKTINPTELVSEIVKTVNPALENLSKNVSECLKNLTPVINSIKMPDVADIMKSTLVQIEQIPTMKSIAEIKVMENDV